MRLQALAPDRSAVWSRPRRGPEEGTAAAPGPADEPAPAGAPGSAADPEAEDTAGAAAAPRGARQLDDKQRDQVSRLQRRDAEVRAHEMAHAAAAGSFGGGASFTYVTGPDGHQYAVGGEVPVRIVGGRTPEEAIRNAAQVRAAALAPAEPSGQDRAVAAEAAAIEAAARAELARSRTAETRAGTVAPAREPAPPEPVAGGPEAPSEGTPAASARAPARKLPELQLDPDATVRQLEQERRSARGQWRHLHLATGCGTCSAGAASYR
jgi:hypothetical protein